MELLKLLVDCGGCSFGIDFVVMLLLLVATYTRGVVNWQILKFRGRN